MHSGQNCVKYYREHRNEDVVPATKGHVLPKLSMYSLAETFKSLLLEVKGHLCYFLRQFETLTVLSVSMSIKPLPAPRGTIPSRSLGHCFQPTWSLLPWQWLPHVSSDLRIYPLSCITLAIHFAKIPVLSYCFPEELSEALCPYKIKRRFLCGHSE